MNASVRREHPDGSANRPKTSRLQAFLDENGITSARLEKETGISRPAMRETRRGRDVRLATARRILRAIRKITGRDVRMEEIFDLEPEAMKD